MSEISERYDRIAGQFTERVRAVPADAWDNAAPCDGWTARDVVRHLVEWPQQFFAGTWDLHFPAGLSVEADPVAAWEGVGGTIGAALADPATAALERDSRMGRRRLDDTVDMILTGDVLIHTWDLSRAAGLDEALDSEGVQRIAAGMAAVDEEMLRGSGQFGPRVEVADDADEQTKLLAFTGRRP
jgi:uncharacterized protein (TIGR03086 family)